MSIEAEINTLLRYDADTGRLYWRVSVGWRAPAGAEAGHITGYGYRRVGIGGKSYAAHRLVWRLAHGVWPSGEIDHKNGLRSDNRLENLRDVTHNLNQRNMRRYAHNTSGITGVCRHNDPKGPGWTARWLDNDGKRHYKHFAVKKFGEEAAKQLAIEYRAAHIKSMGYTARHGT